VGTFKDAIEYVLFATLDCMNRGMSMSETVEAVKLPEKFAKKEYLGEFYGTVEWSVKSIYCGYFGWFDGNAVNLMPVSDREYRETLLELIPLEKLEEKITRSMENGNYQLALQLADLAGNQERKKEALFMRAKQMTSANARHYLIASAHELE
jgi:alkyl sulfatase BDS1-like metallo-beta-lactamase superfamily hydrolase